MGSYVTIQVTNDHSVGLDLVHHTYHTVYIRDHEGLGFSGQKYYLFIYLYIYIYIYSEFSIKDKYSTKGKTVQGAIQKATNTYKITEVHKQNKHNTISSTKNNTQ